MPGGKLPCTVHEHTEINIYFEKEKGTKKKNYISPLNNYTLAK